MKPLKPLLFLTVRSTVNGVVRALTTPRRLISLIIFIGYYFFVFMRPAMVSGAPVSAPDHPMFNFPALDVIEGFVFAIFAIISFFLSFGVLNMQSGFKPADVDVLFSTPISPKLVLAFRICRDYLITLLFPFLLVLL